MRPKNIVIGQKVDSPEIQRAQELRRQMTPEEKILWHHLRTNKLKGFHFRRQQIISRYIVDFYCDKVGLVVELDGDIHLVQVAYDAERDQELLARGFQVLRFRNEEVRHNLTNVLDRILAACLATTDSPSRFGPWPDGRPGREGPGERSE